MPELIALHLPGGQEFVDQLQRAWDAGNAVLPIDVRLPADAVARLVFSMKASKLVQPGRTFDLPDSQPVEPGDALVVATSGSTGAPKGVVHTHATVAASAELTSRRMNVAATDHWLACLPLSHIGGLSVVTRALHMGTVLTVHPKFDADAVMQSVDHGVNLVSLVTTALRRIDAAKFKTILLGGTAIPADRPSNTIATYGSTETGSGIVYEKEPLDGVELRIDVDGQLLVKAPTLLRCYRDGTDPRDADGWFPTGDAATIDDDGLHIHGRIKEVINTGGEKVWPAVVEAALKSHASIHEAIVYGVDDEEWGQRVVARVELHSDETAPTIEQLREHVKITLPAFAAPKEIFIVERLARTTSGKVDRNESARI